MKSKLSYLKDFGDKEKIQEETGKSIWIITTIGESKASKKGDPIKYIEQSLKGKE